MSHSFYQTGAGVFIFYLPLLFSLCVHEWAHARMALWKGDSWAAEQGRLTLNPLAHADLIGTFLLPLMSIFFGLPVFGWAKPVPVNTRALKNPVQDMFWIAFAGPLSNFLLSLTATLILTLMYLLHIWLPWSSTTVLITVLEVFIYLNLLLGLFNLIPLHPLDGGKVLARFLPVEWNWRLEQWQTHTSLILIGFFVLGGFRYLSWPVQWMAGGLVSLAQWSAGFAL